MQTKRKIVFNPDTLQFEYNKPSKKRKFIVWSSSIVILSTVVVWYFGLLGSSHTTVAEITTNEYKVLEKKYKELSEKITNYETSLDQLHKKDAQVYSVLFGVEPIDQNIWQGGTGGKQKNKNHTNFLSFKADKIEDKTNRLEHQLKLQTQSIDKMLKEVKDYEKMLASIPSVKPVKEESLQKQVHLLSGFGKRLHPVFKIWKKHEGMDFSCPRGTKIIATGHGVVEKINGNGRGYGQHILINHGFGYKSLYAHLSSIKVKEGQKVERGTYIGDVGSTGTSTAPHLHYEIHKNGIPIDPINYVLDGLDPDEYEQMIKQASIEGKSMD